MYNSLAKNKPRGAALYLVIATIIIVTILATVILSIVLNQTTVSRHHATRIQAYYAAQAGMNYALEKLRTGSWTWSSCTEASPCNVADSEFPLSLGVGNQQFSVVFCPRKDYDDGSGVSDGLCAPSVLHCDPPPGLIAAGYNYCINISVKYTSPDIPT